MKNLTKKVMMTVAAAMMTSSAALAGMDRPIEVTQLPGNAQQLVKKDFSGRRVAMAKIDDGLFYNGYNVVFTNGDKVEFDSHGQWKEITCRWSDVPSSVVPKPIRSYLKSYYPKAKMLEIERSSKGKYEVKLDNGLEIKFDKDFRVTDIDD